MDRMIKLADVDSAAANFTVVAAGSLATLSVEHAHYALRISFPGRARPAALRREVVTHVNCYVKD